MSGDLQQLTYTLTRISEIGLEDNKELAKKLQKGQFTLRDMHEQFENIQKMGPFGQVMVAMRWCTCVR